MPVKVKFLVTPSGRPAPGWWLGLFVFFFLARLAGADEVWISPTGVDGSGHGTAADPYVCSSEAGFDALLDGSAIPTNSTIHLLPGLFQTVGNVPLKAGWKFRGAGMDATTIQMVDLPALLRANPGLAYMTNVAVYEVRVLGIAPLSYRRDDVEVSDLTVDCNLQNQSAPLAIGAVRLQGANTRISRVRAINWGSEVPNVECFIFGIGMGAGSKWSIETNCIIEGCELGPPAPVVQVQGADGFTIAGNATNMLDPRSPGWVCGAEIRDCTIPGVAAGGGMSKPLYFTGLSIGNGVDGAIMDGNMAVNLTGNASAIGGSCGSLINCDIKDNMLLDVAKGVVFQFGDFCPGGTNSIKQNIRITDNFITVQPGGIGLRPAGIFGQVLTDLLIERNSILAADPSRPINGVVITYDNNVTVKNNIIDAPKGTALEIDTNTGVLDLQLKDNRNRAGEAVEPVYQ